MIIHANILDWAAQYDGEPFHAALMDAPYEMQFMGKDWDNTGVAFNPETWRLIARCLHPGAFLFVMAGTINDDLISVAMRQAGLRKYHRAAAWNYGSGFPKATRIDVQVDRKAGATRRTVGTRKHQPKFDAAGHGYRKKDNGFNSKDRATFDVTEPATDLAQAWAGHRYGGQMLKPALESILIFQKPYAGRPVESITATGAGALNVDGARISMAADDQKGEFGPHKPEHLEQETTRNIYNNAFRRSEADQSSGRWPANFALVHHPACNGACHPDCVVQRLGEQSGESEARANMRGLQVSGAHGGLVEGSGKIKEGTNSLRGHDDSGTAARFFHQSDWMAERLEEADAVGYFAKASRGEREAGLDPRQIALLEEIEELPEGRINDGRQAVSDRPYLRNQTTRRNTHPTIKPIALTRWLATLLLPPALYAPRRLLVPFAGAGSEMVGAMLAGWEDVTGIELEADHVAIAEARLAYWQQRRWELLDPAAPITAKTSATMDGQLDMFLEEP